MPKYKAEITYGGILSFVEAVKRMKWLVKNIGEWVEVSYSILGKSKDPKTRKQLGYYWGLLVPEISKALIALGWTVTVGQDGHEFQRIWDHDGDDTKYTDTHDWLKEHASKIGGDGQHVTLSCQDLIECKRFIENVKFICGEWLNMNMTELEARQPK